MNVMTPQQVFSFETHRKISLTSMTFIIYNTEIKCNVNTVTYCNLCEAEVTLH